MTRGVGFSNPFSFFNFVTDARKFSKVSRQRKISGLEKTNFVHGSVDSRGSASFWVCLRVIALL